MANSSPPRASSRSPAESGQRRDVDFGRAGRDYSAELQKLQKVVADLKSDQVADQRAEVERLKSELKSLADPAYLQLKEEYNRLKREKEQKQQAAAYDQLRAEIEELKDEAEASDDAEYEERLSKQKQKGKLAGGYSRALSVEQAFNFNRTRQEAFGYLTAMKLGPSQVLTPAYVMNSPLGPSTGTVSALSSVQATPGLKVIGALESVRWDLGVEDPIVFSARISAPAKSAIMGIQYSDVPVIDVAVSFVVYEYDQASCQYYVAFSGTASGSDTGGTPILGQIVKSSSDRGLKLSVGFAAATEVWAPQNFALDFEMRPKTGTPQSLYLGTSPLGRLFKKWGQAAVAPTK